MQQVTGKLLAHSIHFGVAVATSWPGKGGGRFTASQLNRKSVYALYREVCVPLF